MLRAVLFTFFGFFFAIVLGLFGAWSADGAGALMGLLAGLGSSFLATAYIMGK